MSKNHKICTSIKSHDSFKSVNGIIIQIYSKQKQSSIKRGHQPPEYSRKELYNWVRNDWLFNFLFINWENCGYITDMKPSIDRLDDSKGYAFNNIRITSWIENKSKRYSFLIGPEKKKRQPLKKKVIKKNIFTTGTRKAVIKYSLKGEYICEYISQVEASKQNDTKFQNISLCCKGKRNHSGGYKWGFKSSLLEMKPKENGHAT